MPDNKPNTGQPVRNEDKKNDEQAKNDGAVLRKSENYCSKAKKKYS